MTVRLVPVAKLWILVLGDVTTWDETGERKTAGARRSVVGVVPTDERTTPPMRHDPGTPSNPAGPCPTAMRRPSARPCAHRWARRLPIGVLGVLAVVAVTSLPASAAGSTVDTVVTTSFGTVLTDAQGFALYTLPTDQSGMSTCTGACVPVWPALTVSAGTTPTAGAGVGGTVAAVLQSNGTYQVTYNGSPLYTFVGDTAPGQVTGNNIGGFKVAQVAAATPTTTVPPTTAPSTATSAPASSSSTSVPGASSPPTTAPAAASSNAPVQPATAAAAAPAAASSSAPVVSSDSTTLAATGPGPALTWMAIVGAGLATSSLLLLAMVADGNGRGRRALAWSRRAGGRVLGR